MQIIINQDDLAAVESEIQDAIQKSGTSLLQNLGEMGVKMLRDAEESDGHLELADLWDMTEVETQADGSLLLEVYSHAENMTFFDKTSRPGLGRVKSSRYPIEGDYLLELLEAGAKRHPIEPVMANVLAFPRRGFEESTVAVSTGIEEFTPGSDLEQFVFSMGHIHPGFQGSHNIENTSDAMEQKLDGMADDAATNIANAFNG